MRIKTYEKNNCERIMETLQQLQAVLPDFLLKFAIAILCGGAIGLEREVKGKAAGFRNEHPYLLRFDIIHAAF